MTTFSQNSKLARPGRLMCSHSTLGGRHASFRGGLGFRSTVLARPGRFMRSHSTLGGRQAGGVGGGAVRV